MEGVKPDSENEEALGQNGEPRPVALERPNIVKLQPHTRATPSGPAKNISSMYSLEIQGWLELLVARLPATPVAPAN